MNKVLFRGVLKLAYRDKYLRENPNDFLENKFNLSKIVYIMI